MDQISTETILIEFEPEISQDGDKSETKKFQKFKKNLVEGSDTANDERPMPNPNYKYSKRSNKKIKSKKQAKRHESCKLRV